MEFLGEPGKAFRPANGSEGESFKEAFCNRCMRERDDCCHILTKSFCYRIDEEGYPPEWIFNTNGSPTCTAFEMVKTEDKR